MTSRVGILRRGWRGARRVARLLRWTRIALPRMAIGYPGKCKRLLIVYDFSSQPFSVGDILIFQEVALVIRDQNKLGKIDMAMVYDPKEPVVPDPAFREIDADSFLFHLSSVLPAAQVNPHLGSLLLFDSHRRLEAYIADNADTYLVWPSLPQYAVKEYLIYKSFDELFHDHFERYGSLPSLRSRPAALRWAMSFILEHVGSAVAVTVQLRRNPANSKRDSNIAAWIGFFRQCVGQYQAKFIVICGRSEVDARLRGLPNVIVAKDHGTNLEQDLALLEVGKFHMGASSGPAAMLHFSEKPYCMFNWDMSLHSFRGLTKEGQRYRFEFSVPLQSWLAEPETEDLLMMEFQRMWGYVLGQNNNEM